MSEESLNSKREHFDKLWEGVVPETTTTCDNCSNQMKGKREVCNNNDCDGDKDKLIVEGINRAKKLKFRQYILEHVRQKKRPLNYENAKRYWMGEIQKEEAESENY